MHKIYIMVVIELASPSSPLVPSFPHPLSLSLCLSLIPFITNTSITGLYTLSGRLKKKMYQEPFAYAHPAAYPIISNHRHLPGRLITPGIKPIEEQDAQRYGDKHAGVVVDEGNNNNEKGSKRRVDTLQR